MTLELSPPPGLPWTAALDLVFFPLLHLESGSTSRPEAQAAGRARECPQSGSASPGDLDKGEDGEPLD